MSNVTSDAFSFMWTHQLQASEGKHQTRSTCTFTFALFNISRVTYQRNNSSTRNGNPVKLEIQSWVWPIFLNCFSPCWAREFAFTFSRQHLLLSNSNAKYEMQSHFRDGGQRAAKLCFKEIWNTKKRKICWKYVLMKLYLSGIFVCSWKAINPSLARKQMCCFKSRTF